MDLGQKVGPLPLGGWVVVVGAGLGVGYFINRNAGKTETPTPTDPGSGTGGGSFLPIAPPEPGETTPETNVSWGVKAKQYLVAQGIDALVANTAIEKFLSGQALDARESAAVSMALARLGPPPESVATPPDDPRPKAPSNFTLTAKTSTSATFTWPPVAGATSYEVSSQNNNTGRKSGPFSTPIPSWFGGNGTPGHSYTFYVRAVNEFGKSEPGLFTVTLSPGTAPPAKPPVKPPVKPPAKPPARPQRRYTIVRGDSLSRISQRFYGTGSRYRTIYNANAGAIEAAARRYGRSSSRGPGGIPGWYIYPGTVLVIP